MKEKKHCKWYNDEFCTNVDSPCVAEYQKMLDEDVKPLIRENQELKEKYVKMLDLNERAIAELQDKNKQLEKDVHDMSWIIKVHKYCVGADHCQNSSTREFELQKQVDDLKEERYYTEQDTAKEILQELYDQIDENTPKWVGAQIKIIAKRKGVEVE